jgi:hypothetical protein
MSKILTLKLERYIFKSKTVVFCIEDISVKTQNSKNGLRILTSTLVSSNFNINTFDISDLPKINRGRDYGTVT